MKKIIILVLILATPGFLYYLLTVKGKNRYKPLAFYGPKQVAKTGHSRHGTYIPDTVYHHIDDFKLTDQLGKTVTFKDFEYKIVVYSFFYTHGPALCTEMNKSVQRLAYAYRKNKMVKFVTITVDPDRDAPEVLKAYAAPYKVEAAKWLFLTGDTATIYNLAQKGLLINAAKTDDGKFVFSDKLVLTDAEKRIRGYYSGATTADVARLHDEIKVQIAEELRKIKAPN